MEGANARARQMRQPDGAHFGAIDRPARTIGGKDGRRAVLDARCFSPSNPSRAPRELEPRVVLNPNSSRMRVINSPSKLWLTMMVAPVRR